MVAHCIRCKGYGWVKTVLDVEDRYDEDDPYLEITCPDCGGSGDYAPRTREGYNEAGEPL